MEKKQAKAKEYKGAETMEELCAIVGEMKQKDRADKKLMLEVFLATERIVGA